MTSRLNSSLSIVAIAALSACGGATQTAEGKFIERVDLAQAQADRVYARPGTLYTAMPTTGSASFTGNASLFIDPVIATDSDDILALGDARLTANFGAGTVTGQVTNLEAAVNFAGTGTSETYDLVPVTGSLQLGEYSSIGPDPDDSAQNRPNQWFASYDGTLTIEGNSYDLGGGILGDFRGTRVNQPAGLSPIRGLSGSSLNSQGFINGSNNPVDVQLEIVAEN